MKVNFCIPGFYEAECGCIIRCNDSMVLTFCGVKHGNTWRHPHKRSKR